ncbi:MAG TPA: NrpR regulatory domain-containing protein [bacterium]|nr:NrpR regulatory domain-containing protein [bacterium]
MNEKTEKKRLAILRILQEADRSLGSSRITEQLMAMGHEVSERTVRFYLLGMDRDGLTENLGKRGRVITAGGLKELGTARVFEKVGFLAAKIDQMTYRMSFDLASRTGAVVINLSMIERGKLAAAAPLMRRVFAAGYAMGRLLALLGPGERLGEVIVPEQMVGIGTVCSITLNGVLLQHGIPTTSRFGGLLELEGKKPTRFVEIITYEGTSLDPLEIFISSGMTNYLGATGSGSGRIGVGFREVPAEARDRVIELAHKLEKIGLGGFLTIGWPGRPLLEIPVSEGRVGAIVIGGLNPVAILEEAGIRQHSRALAGLTDYRNLFPFEELDERIREYQ